LPQGHSWSAELARKLSIAYSGPHSISAYEQHVVWLEGPALGQRHIRKNRVASEATFHKVAHGVHLRLVGSDQTFAQQKLNMAVITRPGHYGALPEVIQAAVTHMGPPSRALLDNTNGTGRARPVFDGKVRPKLDDLFMCSAQCQVQKTHGIEDRLWGMPERLENDLLRHLGCPGSIGVAAHAVDNDEQSRMLRHCGGDSVLVLLAPAKEADIRVVHPQEEFRTSVRLDLALYHPAANERSFRSRLDNNYQHEPPPTLTTIASMTGFARREVSGLWGTLVCEIRSVNHRFLEAGFRLPDELRQTESELRQRLAKEIKRGKVDCSMSYRRLQGADSELEVDGEALARLTARVRDIAKLLPNHTVNVLDILRWPGVLRDDSAVGDELLVTARGLFDATVTDLVEARSREGLRLRELLVQRCGALEGLVAQVRVRLPEVQVRVRTKLNERLAELQVNVDRDRLEQEIALVLQRLDVDEELDRLAGHIVEIRRIVSGNDPAGRRLDFLMQELNREANTLSSKSQDLETTRSAVDMKVIIEQMREQVQNVE